MDGEIESEDTHHISAVLYGKSVDSVGGTVNVVEAC